MESDSAIAAPGYFLPEHWVFRSLASTSSALKSVLGLRLPDAATQNSELGFSGNRHLLVGAWQRSGQSVGYCIDVILNARPTRRQKNYDAHPAVREILLILQILVSRKQQIVASLLGRHDKLPVIQGTPTELVCCRDLVATQSASQREGNPLIEDDLQAAKLRAAYANTISTCFRDTPGNHDR
jgi:hypothetical protein